MAPVGMVMSGIALVAVLVARRGIAGAAERSAVAARLRKLYSLVAALLALRLAMTIVSSAVFAVALMLLASWLPLMALRLVEELRRRHVPTPVKLLALVGGIAFSVVAVTLGFVWSRLALIGLAAFQAVMLAAMIALLARSRQELGAAERRTADTFLMALLPGIPLVATDFTALFPDLAVRGGPFAFLVLVLATSRLVSEQGSPLQLAGDLGVAAGAGGLTVVVARAALPGLEVDSGMALAAGGAGIAMLLLLVERFAEVRWHQPGLVAALAGAPDGDRDAIITAHPLLASGRILADADLARYPAASLSQLVEHRVISADTRDVDDRDAARDLLDAAGATHLLRISREPPRFLAIAAGGLAGPMLDDELAIAARLIEGTA